MRSILTFIFLGLLLSSFGQHRSVLMSSTPSVCEPSIKMDPNNPQILVAGLVLDHVLYSHDGGEKWTEKKLESPYGVWGDPVIDVDTNGHFYYFHLSNPEDGDWIDRIVCQRSEDQGRNWNEGTFTGLNGEKDQDKHWTVVDQRDNTIYITWTEFDKYGSKEETCHSRIRFSKSQDSGESWQEPSTISTVLGNCLDDDDTVEGAVPAVGPEGQLYVSWAGPEGISFRSSMDGGDSWTDEVTVDAMPGGWTYDIPGIYRANGLPITKVDLSGGPHHGDIYINWSDQRNGKEDTDVWITRSSDGGKTWSKAKKVNQDESNRHQFFTWMDIDQTNGLLYVFYYDRRNSEGNKTAVYMSISADGGEHFHDFPISQETEEFIPDDKVFFGDYTNLTVHNGICRPIWTRLHEGKTSVWTSIVDTEQLDDRLFLLSPKFELEKKDTVCLVLEQDGKRIAVLDKRKLDQGHESFDFIWSCPDQDSGVYQIHLIQDDKVLWTKELQLND